MTLAAEEPEPEPEPELEEGDDGQPLAPLAWAERHRRIDDQPFSLERFKPLREPYNDDHPFQVNQKCAQAGVSEMAITKAIHALDVGAAYWGTGKAGLNVAYLFPTRAALSDFSKERFGALPSESEHLENLFSSGYDDVGFKQAGASYLYLRGTHSKKSLKSFPADFLVLDEYDEMDPVAVAMADKRLRASLVKRKLVLSTPMLPGRGIHELYLQSDQRVWEVPCPHCGAWQEMDFWRDVYADGVGYEEWRHWDTERLWQATFTVMCQTCGGALDRFADGRWIARRPEITRIRGYHIPPLAFPSVGLAELAVKAISDNPEEIAELYRSDLGLPYEAGGSKVTDTMLALLSTDLEHGELPTGATWKQTTMGVDVGKGRFFYRISSTGPDKRRYVRAMGIVRQWSDLDTLMKQYKVRRCVVDMNPEINAAPAWAATHKGRVLLAQYPTSAGLKATLFMPEVDKLEDVVSINRTMAMDQVYAAIASGDEVWPKTIHSNRDIAAHLKAPVRVEVKDKHGQLRATWVHTTPDDFYHACVYDRIAFATLPKSSGIEGIGIIQGSATGWQ